MPPIVEAPLVAFISASPEILTAMRAALANRMQPVVNIALGVSLFTAILTVPVIEPLGLFTDKPIQMALTPVQTTMVLLTLVIAGVNLHDGETNAIEGMTHYVLFAKFLMLASEGSSDFRSRKHYQRKSKHKSRSTMRNSGFLCAYIA